MKQLYYILILSLLMLASCGGNQSKQSDTNDGSDTISYAPGTRTMKRSIEDVRMLRTHEEYRDMIIHFWDDFDFNAGEDVVAYDTLDIIYAMCEYVAYIPAGDADSLLRGLIHRASVSRPVLQFFTTITETVLHDPNSPYRNDEYYIPVLEAILESPHLDEYERIVPTFDLEIARKNRIGQLCNNIEYTMSNGRKGWLHDIDADYTILMFSNPGCPMCKEIMDEITASPIINELTEIGRIKTISIYPDEDIDTWRAYLDEMPELWIKAYDDGMKISQEQSYNLNAIPSLYLLDNQKHVIIKDGTSVAHIEDMIAMLESM